MPGDPGVAQYTTEKVSLRDVMVLDNDFPLSMMAVANGFPLSKAAFTQEHVVYGAQKERTGQGLRAAIQVPERDKVGRPNQRGQQRGGDLGNSESCVWLQPLVLDSSRNLPRLSGCLLGLHY